MTSVAYAPTLRSVAMEELEQEEEILRLSGAAAREYLKLPVLPTRPVVFTDLMADRPALREWTPAFFRSRYPSLVCEVEGERIMLREQLDRIAVSTTEHPAPYPFSFDLARCTPELLKDLEPHLRFGTTDRTLSAVVPRAYLGGTIVHELFFGGEGACYPILHYDLLAMHTQITQIHGEKEVFLFDPTQTPLLYADPDCPRVSRIPDVFAPDLERFPAFRAARPLRVLLRPGETLYFPAGWWHTTRIHGPSITYGRAVLNAANWHRMLRERRRDLHRTHPLLAWPAFAFGRVLGSLLAAGEARPARTPHA